MFLFQITRILSIVICRCIFWRLGVIKIINTHYAEWLMKKIGSFLLAFIFLISLSNAAGAAERIVQMTVPGCFS